MSLEMVILFAIVTVAATSIVAILLLSFNWRVFAVWNGGETYQFHRMGTLFRHIETIEGPLLKDKTRPIIGHVCHVTFFPCDTKYLGDFVVCYTAADSENFRKMGYHWIGKCACKEKHHVQPMVRMKS